MSITTSELSSIPATRAGGFDTERALAAIERVLDDEPRPVALHEPQFAGSEWEYVKETLDTGWVSSAGKFVERFERQLADYCQVPHAVAVVNGTAALQVCLMLAGVHATTRFSSRLSPSSPRPMRLAIAARSRISAIAVPRPSASIRTTWSIPLCNR